MDSSTPAWEADRAQHAGNHSEASFCDIISRTTMLLSFIIALVGLAGNATVLWLLGFRMRRDAFSVYILNLSGANFLFLCSHILFFLKAVLFFFHSISFHIPLFFFTVPTLAYLAGVSMLTAISAEHWMSAIWPLWYQCRRPKHTSAVICTLLWALSLLLSFLEGQSCRSLFNSFDFDQCRKVEFVIFAWLLVLFLVLFRSNQALLVRIFCGSQQIPVTKLYVTIVVTVVVFLLCGFQFGISVFLLQWIRDFYDIIPCYYFPVITLLSCINSCANPIICLFIGSISHCRFKCGTLKMILHRAVFNTPEEEEGGERGSSGEDRELNTL
ncbi:LOW QUALITY PROTEIN: mas-related G-protein coupled receptor member B8-like [Mesocricetus auratus]|uniref:LOW QUALITY PROTEIN: mas-related G-protein coupled receptor member B8-like n=1 Tax=Mesocricetus auratus TaxID=10036 RepID=A0ABM2X2R8_MESAU|nr:LOW QUALITY PROTEIN: mas-related G-protein coupled receptor member B8-like [Mesocricetus auratus]